MCTSTEGEENAGVMSHVMSGLSTSRGSPIMIQKHRSPLSCLSPLSDRAAAAPASGCPPTSSSPQNHLFREVSSDCNGSACPLTLQALLVLTVCTLPCPFSPQSFLVLDYYPNVPHTKYFKNIYLISLVKCKYPWERTVSAFLGPLTITEPGMAGTFHSQC